VHIALIHVLIALSWEEQVKEFGDLLVASKLNETKWVGQTLFLWEFDEVNPIITKWRPVFEALAHYL